MTWSYSGDPGDSALDEIRFLIQDTDTTDQLLSNEEVTYMYDSYGDAYSAAIACVGVLIAKGSRAQEESKRVGDLSLSVKSGARVEQWLLLMDSLKAERFRRYPAAPVINPTVLVTTAEKDTSDEGSDFVIGQMDNKT